MAKIKIVFIENDWAYLTTIKETLEGVGLEVIPATSQEEARAVLSRSDVDLAIMDIRLEDDNDEKDVTGLLLAAEDAFLSIPKIILTAFPIAEYARIALSNIGGTLPLAVDFVAKQEGTGVLLTSLTKALANAMQIRPRARGSRHQPRPVGREVFIIHGHDEEAKLQVMIFLFRLGLIPVVLSEQVVDGGTIIEQIEKYGGADFAIAIMTPDDFGGAKKERDKISDRARQNVIFEMGYFIGRLSRSRVRVLCKEGIEMLSDFHGVLYIRMDVGGGWKIKLARELKESGFDINTDNVL